MRVVKRQCIVVRRVAGALFDALAAGGRVQPVLDRIDKPRLLLG